MYKETPYQRSRTLTYYSCFCVLCHIWRHHASKH